MLGFSSCCSRSGFKPTCPSCWGDSAVVYGQMEEGGKEDAFCFLPLKPENGNQKGRP